MWTETTADVRNELAPRSVGSGAMRVTATLGRMTICRMNKSRNSFKGPWDQPGVRLFGRTLTLNHLEHDIIRKDYPDPRIHFALICAARGCPPLRDEVYVAERLEEQLNDQARQFLATPVKNRVDAGARTVYLSPIFKWYGADFEKKHGSVLAAMQPYWPKESASALAQGGFKIRYSDYDWSLNQTTR
jgi:hypothetical protein